MAVGFGYMPKDSLQDESSLLGPSSLLSVSNLFVSASFVSIYVDFGVWVSRFSASLKSAGAILWENKTILAVGI